MSIPTTFTCKAWAIITRRSARSIRCPTIISSRSLGVISTAASGANLHFKTSPIFPRPRRKLPHSSKPSAPTSSATSNAAVSGARLATAQRGHDAGQSLDWRERDRFSLIRFLDYGIARRLVSTPVFASALRSAVEENPCTEPSASATLPCFRWRVSFQATGVLVVAVKTPGVTGFPP